VNNPTIKVCQNTIRSRIKESGELGSYVAARKPFLIEDQVKRRLEWCRVHVRWSIEDWKRVLFSDESPFVLRYAWGRRVWRRVGERYKPEDLMRTIKHDKKINVWGCFSYYGVGNLCRIHGLMDGRTYTMILDNEMIPSAQRLYGNDDWIFQHDNAPNHTSKVVKEYLEMYDIRILDWPANSPDLNP